MKKAVLPVVTVDEPIERSSLELREDELSSAADLEKSSTDENKLPPDGLVVVRRRMRRGRVRRRRRPHHLPVPHRCLQGLVKYRRGV